MNNILLEDLDYRIRNVRHAIDTIADDESDYDDWDAGYREGRLQQLQSELRFLKSLLKVAA